MIDIIIPAFNSHNTIVNAISSVVMQSIHSKINIIIIDDKSNKNYNEIVNFYKNKISIKEINLQENKGPGVARQIGIENSNSEFIIFLDSDDCFNDYYSIAKLYNKIIEEKSDLVIGNIIEELDNNIKIHKKSESWLHGKIYRRKFLEKNNIKFNESRYNEDSGFNELIFLSNAKISFLDENISIWKNNIESITRKTTSRDFRKKFFSGYIYNMKWALNIAIERKYSNYKIAKLSYDITLFLYYNYILMLQYDIINELLIEAKEIFDINNKYNKYLTDSQKNEILNEQFNQMKEFGNLEQVILPKITYNDFMSGKRIYF